MKCSPDTRELKTGAVDNRDRVKDIGRDTGTGRNKKAFGEGGNSEASKDNHDEDEVAVTYIVYVGEEIVCTMLIRTYHIICRPSDKQNQKVEPYSQLETWGENNHVYETFMREGR